MNLVEMNIPAPKAMRAGWAALAAVHAARGWKTDIYAQPGHWQFHDGGGNWAILRKIDENQFVLIGHDHEYSETYFREAAEYFQEEETDLLLNAPEWWSNDLGTGAFENWDGLTWKRAAYDKEDGFNSVGLIESCCNDPVNTLKGYAADAPGLEGKQPDEPAIEQLVAADAHITHELLGSVVPGWDIDAGVSAGKQFLDMVL